MTRFKKGRASFLQSYLATYSEKCGGPRGAALEYARSVVTVEFINKYQVPEGETKESLAEVINTWLKNRKRERKYKTIDVKLVQPRAPPKVNTKAAQELMAKALPDFDEKLTAAATSRNVDRFRARPTLLKTLWESLSAEDRDTFLSSTKDAVAGQSAEGGGVLLEGEDGAVETPEEARLMNVDALPHTVDQFLLALARETNFAFHLMVGGYGRGGPVSFSVRHGTTPAGLQFPEFHPSYEDQVQRPWTRFVELAKGGPMQQFGRSLPTIQVDQKGRPLLPNPLANWTRNDYCVMLTRFLEVLWEHERPGSTICWENVTAAANRLPTSLSLAHLTTWTAGQLTQVYELVVQQQEEHDSAYVFFADAPPPPAESEHQTSKSTSSRSQQRAQPAQVAVKHAYKQNADKDVVLAPVEKGKGKASKKKETPFVLGPPGGAVSEMHEGNEVVAQESGKKKGRAAKRNPLVDLPNQIESASISSKKRKRGDNTHAHAKEDEPALPKKRARRSEVDESLIVDVPRTRKGTEKSAAAENTKADYKKDKSVQNLRNPRK